MIKKFKEFESISGTELVGHMGPNWGEEKNSPLIKGGMTDVIFCPEMGRIVPEKEIRFLREVIIWKYRILYTYLNQEITVIRITHSSRPLGKI